MASPSAPESHRSPSAGDAGSPALPFGETATIAGFAMTPLSLQTRTGPVYDREGDAMEGEDCT
jgi:hypothetical protein